MHCSGISKMSLSSLLQRLFLFLLLCCASLAALEKKNALHTSPASEILPSTLQTFQLIPYGNLYSSQAHMVYPQTASEVQCIIQEAERTGKTISTLGKSMSQGKQAISNRDWNIILCTSKLNQIKIDPELKIAKVGAGATWKELQEEANQLGLAVKVMQTSNIFSIGGSIATNCHGCDFKTGCLHNTLLSLILVDAKARILEITSDHPLFEFIVGGYGGFGIIVEATIALTDNVEMIEEGVEVIPENYVSYFEDHIRNNDDIDMHLYRLSLQPKQLFHNGIAINYKKLSYVPIVSKYLDDIDANSRKDRIKIHTNRKQSCLRHLAWNLEKQHALTGKISTRNEFMSTPITSLFNHPKMDSEWLQEYFVKGEKLAEFLVFLSNILQKNQVAVFNAYIRFIPQDTKTKLSYVEKGDRFGIVLFFNQKLSTKEIGKTKIWVQKVIDYLINQEGSYYLPYQHFATIEQFKSCYPHWETVASFKKNMDPKNILDNGFFADYLSSTTIHAALLRQVFQNNNGFRQEIGQMLNNIFLECRSS